MDMFDNFHIVFRVFFNCSKKNLVNFPKLSFIFNLFRSFSIYFVCFLIEQLISKIVRSVNSFVQQKNDSFF